VSRGWRAGDDAGVESCGAEGTIFAGRTKIKITT
jgi:hypothetical protein